MNFDQYTTLTPEESISVAQSNTDGLSDTEASIRLKKYGLNKLTTHQVIWWKILYRQIQSPFIYLLLTASIISFILGELLDGCMIILFIIINTSLGFYQEYRSEKTIELLKEYQVSRARVLRNGKEQIINAETLVPGDIIILTTGDMIPADARLLNTQDIEINESILTGESVSVHKTHTSLDTTTNEMFAANNIVFSGTIVVSGWAKAVVIATGSMGALGTISTLTNREEEKSSLEKGLTKFSTFIIKLSLITIACIFIANIFIKGPDSDIIHLTLFSIALTISVIPEALPIVITFALSSGALHLAKQNVIVKKLSAIEDLGNIEILCTDKTGTLTQNKLTVADIYPQNSREPLILAMIAASEQITDTVEPNNAFDIAIYSTLSESEKIDILQWKRCTEQPFNPETRKNSVIVQSNNNTLLIVRGAFEEIIKFSKNNSPELQKWVISEGIKGRRIVAIAKKETIYKANGAYPTEDNLNIIGVISFEDPLKESTKSAIRSANEMRVQIKMLTGDAPEVALAIAQQLNMVHKKYPVITGKDFSILNDEEQREVAHQCNVFARISPEQKYRIIEILREKYRVGYLGEGINDAPALKIANVGLVVDSGSDIAKEAGDIILMQKDLNIIINGISEGRMVFANTVKYIKTTLSSNFGNFYAVAISSLFISYLPMLPLQILLLNLLSDFPMIAIASDSVDPEELRSPKEYNIRDIINISTFLGMVSTIFDFVIFAIFVQFGAGVLQTSWFVGSIINELLFIFSSRTRLPFWKAVRPGKMLSLLSIVAIIITLILPYTSFGIDLFKFESPTMTHLGIIMSILIIEFIVTEIVKLAYYRYESKKFIGI